jgi:hypothetical protein
MPKCPKHDVYCCPFCKEQLQSVFVLKVTDEDYRDYIIGIYTSLEGAQDEMHKQVPEKGYDEDELTIEEIFLDEKNSKRGYSESHYIAKLREKIFKAPTLGE